MDASDRLYPLLIVGAGPHALPLVTKLLEPNLDPLEEQPSNDNVFYPKKDNDVAVRAKHTLFPDSYKLQNDKHIRRCCGKAYSKRAHHAGFLQKVCIVDRNEAWLGQWKRQFQALENPASPKRPPCASVSAGHSDFAHLYTRK